jgi:hypothetical protein
VCGQWEADLTKTCPGPAKQPEQAKPDLGFDAPPARYNNNPDGRETIDRMFDEAETVFDRVFDPDDHWHGLHADPAHAINAALCAALALKYEDRNGKKGDPDGDANKAKFYRQMQARWEQNDASLDPRRYKRA